MEKCDVQATKRTPNSYLPTGERCGKVATETFDDQLVGWVNDELASKGFMINGNSICREHLNMTPEI